MPNLLVKPKGDHGLVTKVTPETAGWTYVGFEIYKLKAGEMRVKKRATAKSASSGFPARQRPRRVLKISARSVTA